MASVPVHIRRIDSRHSQPDTAQADCEAKGQGLQGENYAGLFCACSAVIWQEKLTSTVVFRLQGLSCLNQMSR